MDSTESFVEQHECCINTFYIRICLNTPVWGPAISRAVWLVRLGEHFHFVSHHESTVEAHSKLSNDSTRLLRPSLALQLFQKCLNIHTKGSNLNNFKILLRTLIKYLNEEIKKKCLIKNHYRKLLKWTIIMKHSQGRYSMRRWLRYPSIK